MTKEQDISRIAGDASFKLKCGIEEARLTLPEVVALRAQRGEIQLDTNPIVFEKCSQAEELVGCWP